MFIILENDYENASFPLKCVLLARNGIWANANTAYETIRPCMA